MAVSRSTRYRAAQAYKHQLYTGRPTPGVVVDFDQRVVRLEGQEVRIAQCWLY